jgi:peptide/nickel transport system permease protein
MITFNYILKRVALSLALVLGVVAVTFVAINFAPGDPALVWAGKPRGPEAATAIESARRYLGLDLPLHIRLATYIYRFSTGDWGTSVRFKLPVLSIVVRSFAASLELIIYSFAIATPLALWLGTRAAVTRGSTTDRVIYYVSAVLAGSPRFLLAGLLYLALYVANYSYLGLRLDPAYSALRGPTGFATIDTLLLGRLDAFADAVLRVIPPALAISTYPLGVLVRIVRVALSEAFEEEYVRQAVSLGIARKVVVRRYAFPSILPVISQLSGLMFAYLLIDAMVVENVFSREGLGEIVAKAVVSSDYPLLIGATVFVAIVLIAVNTIADIVQATIDPRVRL